MNDNPLRFALTLLALALFSSACGRDLPLKAAGTSPADAQHHPDIPLHVDVPTPDVAAPDLSGPDVEVDPYPDAWVAPPPDWCDKAEHQAIVKWTFDGDTVELNSGERVRLIGVDAPELSGDECWSQEAKEQLRDLTYDGAVVCLREDITSSPVDPYGRLLRYVFIRLDSGQWGMVNARLVRLGAAPAFHQYLKGKVYEQEFEEAEHEAYVARLGGWASCNW